MTSAIQPLSLYHLTEDLVGLERELLEAGGELTPEIEAAYEELLEMHAGKIEAYVAMIRKFEASAEGIRSERERLQAAERTMANAAKSLKDRLRDAMVRRGETEHLTRLGKVRLQRSSVRPVVLKVLVEELPDWFKRVKVEVDLKALAAALKEGDAGEYAELGEASQFIRIY